MRVHGINSATMPCDRITYEWLRSRGFRLESNHVDIKPHLALMLSHQEDVALEVSESMVEGWTVWLRSDVAHSRCRFCYLRTVKTIDQMNWLIEGITDRWPLEVDWDPVSFAEALAKEKEDCVRRYQEYCKKERHGRVPGG